MQTLAHMALLNAINDTALKIDKALGRSACDPKMADVHEELSIAKEHIAAAQKYVFSASED